jgi:hypothetical protein
MRSGLQASPAVPLTQTHFANCSPGDPDDTPRSPPKATGCEFSIENLPS